MSSQLGGHLQFRPGDRIGRIKGFFVHNLLGVERLFVKLTELLRTGLRDEALDLPLLTLGEDIIVGLPQIAAKRLYVVGIPAGSS